ncbi:MAG TPA: sodium ion-translocating decarboxylase subunit beta [Prolixibacteraceae bacterium]|nr:sodium ion-translocating decarboxylase subunit beta [Prolixibacteraceae bacterium]
MENIDLGTLFQGIGTLFTSDLSIVLARLGLIALGLLLIYLGQKKVLEPLLMIPMGLGMATINASVMILPGGNQGNLFVDPLITDTQALFDILQINWLQPIYTFTFSNGLIACCIFMGIGVLLDVGYMLRRPFLSIFLALFAELGTFLVVPIASSMGMSLRDSASIAMVGGADGPMVLFTSMILSKDLFVPITIVAYLYLGFTYGGYPYLIKLLVPKHIRGIQPPKPAKVNPISAEQKLLFSVVMCVILCLLFPVAAPLFFSLFLGVAVREADIKPVVDFIKGPLLYGSTFFLGLLLGILCEAHLIMNPKILPLLLMGILALLLSGIGGLLGGYIVYWWTGGKFNPVIGIAGVSCVPSTAKVAQKAVTEVNPNAIILQDALGANISGVITTAIITGLYVTLIPLFS